MANLRVDDLVKANFVDLQGHYKKDMFIFCLIDGFAFNVEFKIQMQENNFIYVFACVKAQKVEIGYERKTKQQTPIAEK